MAGDWIKMRNDLAEDPSVIGIACDLGIEEDLVVGKLHRIWSWADRQSRNGHAGSVTYLWLDRYIGVTGFGEAMEKHGWLTQTEDGIAFPNFDRHNGKPAKTRALAANRKQKERHAPSVTKNGQERDQRREEKSTRSTYGTSPRTQAIAWSESEGFENIKESDISDWREAYPACDVRRQLAAAHQWLLANPTKAKKKQWRRFITGWLSRSQERGGDTQSVRSGAVPRSGNPPTEPKPRAKPEEVEAAIKNNTELMDALGGLRPKK